MPLNIEKISEFDHDNKTFHYTTVQLTDITNKPDEKYLLYHPPYAFHNIYIYITLTGTDKRIPGKKKSVTHQTCDMCNSNTATYSANSVQWKDDPRQADSFICDSCKKELKETAETVIKNNSNTILSHSI